MCLAIFAIAPVLLVHPACMQGFFVSNVNALGYKECQATCATGCPLAESKVDEDEGHLRPTQSTHLILSCCADWLVALRTTGGRCEFYAAHSRCPWPSAEVSTTHPQSQANANAVRTGRLLFMDVFDFPMLQKFMQGGLMYTYHFVPSKGTSKSSSSSALPARGRTPPGRRCDSGC